MSTFTDTAGGIQLKQVGWWNPITGVLIAYRDWQDPEFYHQRGYQPCYARATVNEVP